MTAVELHRIDARARLIAQHFDSEALAAAVLRRQDDRTRRRGCAPTQDQR
jgi:hypothetical protein